MRVLGLDPALGGGCSLIACELTGDKLYVLDCLFRVDLSQTEQILAMVEEFSAAYRPSLVIIETDAQQKAYANDDRTRDMAERYGFRVVPHLTRGEKSDQAFGVASMDSSFRKGEIRIPWGSPETQLRMTPLVHQLRAWRPDVKTKYLTQDCVMSLWFVWRYWMKVREVHAVPPAPAWRPSWSFADPRKVTA